MTQRVSNFPLHPWCYLASLVEAIFLSVNGTITWFFLQDLGGWNKFKACCCQCRLCFSLPPVIFYNGRRIITNSYTQLMLVQCINGNTKRERRSNYFLPACVCVCVCVCVCARARVKYAEFFYDEKLWYLWTELFTLDLLPYNLGLHILQFYIFMGLFRRVRGAWTSYWMFYYFVQ